MDVLTPEQRSRCMARVRNRNTAPELQLRKSLWAVGLRYRLNYKLFGKPDLVFISARVAVFIDGCFWHGCPIHGKTPVTNEAFWAAKILRNKQRDNTVGGHLAEMGWTVCRFWEHQIKFDLPACVNEVSKIIKDNKIYGPSVKSKRS